MSDFRKNVIKLFSGAVIAQLAPWAISPILARIYTPEEFGLLTIFLSILNIGNTIITAKYEIAIYLPRQTEQARYVVKLNILVSIVITTTALIIFLLFGSQIKELLQAQELDVFFYLAPVVVLLLGLYKIFYSWLNRLKQYTTLAASKVVRSATLSVSQLGLGFTAFKAHGLIIGQMIGELVAAGFIVIASIGTIKLRREAGDRQGIAQTAKEYIGFPKYSLPGDFVNSVSNQAPVFIFGGVFGTAIVGQYGMTYRVLTAPLTLLARAILDVFKQQASEDYANTGSCRKIFVVTLKRLAMFSFPIFLIIGIFSEPLFTLIFGEQWRQAGEFAQIMAILFFVRFVASPLSYVLYIAQKQKVDLIWQLTLAVVLISSIYIGVAFDDFYLSLWLFTLSYSAMYLIYLYLSYKYSERKE
ncbi:MAG: oligosaccharide flippase family protein [Saprospiraceae bacterium]|nr:oligosaccharide flippase family protein [Saprospiraceae bacterium]